MAEKRRFSSTPLASTPVVKRIALLVYGSVIDDPGKEIKAAQAQVIPNVQTPFPVEYARSSKKRDGGPTLVPMPPESGFSPVKAELFVMRSGVTEKEAADMLYRREIGKVGGGQKYHPDHSNPNQVFIERLGNAFSCDVVLYTRIAPNIHPLTASELARLAIESARGNVGAAGEDGISYLRRMITLGITTKLTPDYVREIQQRTKASDVQSAWQAVRDGRV